MKKPIKFMIITLLVIFIVLAIIAYRNIQSATKYIEPECQVENQGYDFSDKLQHLLNHPKLIEEIRHRGRSLFQLGYNPKKSAFQFYSYLKEELK